MVEEGLSFGSGSGDSESFVPYSAREGALYPVDGGMVAGVKANCSIMEADCMVFSGIRNIKKAISGLNEIRLSHPVFLELLACEGGCVNGPKASQRNATAWKRCQIIDYAQYPGTAMPQPG